LAEADTYATDTGMSGADASEIGDAAPYPLAEDDPRLGPPSQVTETPVDPQLALLPTHEMTWPDFERLLLRVAREVQGLRSVRLFGNPG
jgi:hypothetical protein